MRPVQKIIVHHSASAASTTMEQIRHWHLGRGYSDVGYHLVIEASTGLVRLARHVELVGAHDAGENTGSIGVCLTGSYVGIAPSQTAWRALVSVVCDLLEQYALPVSAVRGHKEDEPRSTPTECPGFDPAGLRSAVKVELSRRSQLPGARKAGS